MSMIHRDYICFKCRWSDYSTAKQEHLDGDPCPKCDEGEIVEIITYEDDQ